MWMHRNTMCHALYTVCAAFIVGTSPGVAEDENGLSLLLPPEMRKSLAEARFDPTRLPARLVDWPVFEWTINARAACGVGLSKFGLLVSVKDQGAEGNAIIRRILSRGAALNLVSEEEAPPLNALAWRAEVSTQDEGFNQFLAACEELFESAEADGRLDSAAIAAGEVEADRILSGATGDAPGQ